MGSGIGNCTTERMYAVASEIEREAIARINDAKRHDDNEAVVFYDEMVRQCITVRKYHEEVGPIDRKANTTERRKQVICDLWERGVAPRLIAAFLDMAESTVRVYRNARAKPGKPKQPREVIAARDKAIVDDYLAGQSFAAIGRARGLGAERARQICNRYEREQQSAANRAAWLKESGS